MVMGNDIVYKMDGENVWVIVEKNRMFIVSEALDLKRGVVRNLSKMTGRVKAKHGTDNNAQLYQGVVNKCNDKNSALIKGTLIGCVFTRNLETELERLTV